MYSDGLALSGNKKPFKIAIEELTNGVAKDKQEHTAFYGGICDSGKLLRTFDWACHGQLSRITNCDLLFSKYMPLRKSTGTYRDRPKMELAHKLYFRWITSKQSPWLPVLKAGMSLKKRPEFTKRFWYETGFIFDQTSKVPANYLANFLIATRICRQWPDYAEGWYDLVHEYDVDPSMALWLMSAYNYGHHWSLPSNLRGANKDRKWSFWPNERGDWMLNVGPAKDTSIVRFFNAKPNKSRLLPDFKQHSGYRPCNNIWDDDEANVGKKWSTKVKETYSGTIGVLEKSNNMGTAQTIWLCTTKDLAEIGHAEEKRLGIK